MNVHAKSRLTLELCGHSGQKPRARPQPAWTGRRPSPASCGSACYRMACAELTATVTAIAATSGKRQRPATAHNARTIRANLGYVRPEKRKVCSATSSGASVTTPCCRARSVVSFPVSFSYVRPDSPGHSRPCHRRSQTATTRGEHGPTDLESVWGQQSPTTGLASDRVTK